MIKPFEWYVHYYNMVGKSRRKAAYRFSKDSWDSLMSYRQYELEEAVEEALKKPKIELLQEAHLDPNILICNECQSTDWIGGAAMTNYNCANCKQANMWGSTATPKLCSGCAFKLFSCLRCGEYREKDL